MNNHFQWSRYTDIPNYDIIKLQISFRSTGISICTDRGSGIVTTSSHLSSVTDVRVYINNPGNSTSISMFCIGY